MVVVMNTTAADIVHVLNNSLDDEAGWASSKFSDYAKLWEEVEILKNRVSDQGGLIVWRTESEGSLQSSPRRHWSPACGLGNAQSLARTLQSLETPCWKGAETYSGCQIEYKPKVHSHLYKSILRDSGYVLGRIVSNRTIVEHRKRLLRDWNLHPEVF